MSDPLFTLAFLAVVAIPVIGVFFLVGKRAPFLTRIIMGLMAGMITWILAIILMNVGASIMNGNTVTIYVLASETKAAGFTADLGRIAARHGLVPNPGQVTDEEGSTEYVLEAKGQGLRLWSTNMPLSGQEDAAQCGHYDEVHSDPGQFVLTVTPVLLVGSQQAAQALLSSIRNELKAAGYDIRAQSVMCSPLSKAHAHTY